MAKKKPCKEPGCEEPKFRQFHRCYFHHLLTLPADRQAESSAWRLRHASGKPGFVHRARVPASEWPEGERWCSGCQWFVPLFYVRGSRCAGCAGKAAHHGHVQRTYGITGEQYEALLAFQGGRCYICQRLPGKVRLAVDHDHRCGSCGGSGCPACVRGLLCAAGDRSCNHGILGNIKDLDMARRIVDYLVMPPLRQMQGMAAIQQEAPAPQATGASDPFEDLDW